MIKIKQRYCKECKVPVAKGKSWCPQHRHRWHRPSSTHLKCKECDVTKPIRWFAKGKNICKPCNSVKWNGKDLVFSYLSKELTKLLRKYKTSKQHQEKAIKVKIPQHKLHIGEVKRELAEFEKRVDKERRAIVYRYRQAEGRIQVNERTIKNRKMRWKEWEKDIAQHIVNNFPPSDYSNKYHWTKSMFDVTNLVSKQYDIKISVLKKHINDIFGYKGTETAWIKHIDNKIKEIQPNYTGEAPWILECTCCGKKKEKPNRSSLVRVLGFGGSGDKKNTGMCTDCSMAEKRAPHPPRSEEWLLENRMKEIRRLGYNSIEEYEENLFVMGRKDTYYDKVDALSRTNLKNYKPELYKLWRENTWDGTNYKTGMTIEHKTPKSVCWKKRWSIEKAARISNLDVITQKQNNQSWMDYSAKKVLIKENNFW
jgi:hypothetical protein